MMIEWVVAELQTCLSREKRECCGNLWNTLDALVLMLYSAEFFASRLDEESA
jgi:hypothetical protein